MVPLGVLIALGIGVITGIHGDEDAKIDYHEGPKIVGFNSSYLYRAYYTAKSYDDAEQACVESNGHLITIDNNPTMTLVEVGLFDEDLLDAGNELSFFWIGLRWENRSWSFEGPSSWIGPASYSNWDDDPEPDSDDKHCVGVKFYPRGEFKWHLEDCTTKAPYLCMELNTKCLPLITAEDGTQEKMQVSKNNYGCPNYRDDMIEIINDCECNRTYEINHDMQGRVCDDDKHVTKNKICIPGCNVQQAPIPDNAILLDRDQVYHEGSRVAYYCPGVFEYYGAIHPHNLIEVPCRAGEDYSKTVRHLLCHAHVDHQIKEIITVHASLNYDYKLHCNHKGTPWLTKAQRYIWYHGRREITSNTEIGTTKYKVGGPSTGGDLEITDLSEDATGSYFCIAKYMHSYLPGNSYNVTTEHHAATLAAIEKWNNYGSAYLGHFYDPNNGTYFKHVAYFDLKTFDQARNACETSAPGGRLALVAGLGSHRVLNNLFSPEMIDANYQFEERTQDYPDTFWSGMQLNMHTHFEWMDISEHKMKDMLPWYNQDEGAKHHGQCAAIKLHLVPSGRNNNDKLSMFAVRCQEMLPYVCTYPADQCLPQSVSKVADPDNYKCNNNTNQLVKIKTDGCQCTSTTKVDLENHESCTKNDVWSTALCAPECTPNPEYGAIVYPDEKYYYGMYMTYFCPGHFEVNGMEYNHNSLALKCDPNRKEVLNLQCRREKILSENALVTVIRFNMETLNKSGHPIELECKINPLYSDLGTITWMIKNEFNLDVWKDDRLKSVNGDYTLLTGPSYSQDGNKLKIKHVDESIRGVYGCYFDTTQDKKVEGDLEEVGILLPGNVYKIMFDGDEDVEEEEKSVTSTSSLPTSWLQTGVYVHHFVMLLLLLVLVS